MSKHNTLKKIAATAVVIGTAMYVANEYIIKKQQKKIYLKEKMVIPIPLNMVTYFIKFQEKANQFF